MFVFVTNIRAAIFVLPTTIADLPPCAGVGLRRTLEIASTVRNKGIRVIGAILAWVGIEDAHLLESHPENALAREADLAGFRGITLVADPLVDLAN